VPVPVVSQKRSIADWKNRQLTVCRASVSMKPDGRQRHLESPDFYEVAGQYSSIVFPNRVMLARSSPHHWRMIDFKSPAGGAPKGGK
jgi:hypothetical protein